LQVDFCHAGITSLQLDRQEKELWLRWIKGDRRYTGSPNKKISANNTVFML
jgi:hypothetical protein